MKDGQAELDALAEESLTKSDGRGDVPIHTSRFVVEATRVFPKDGILIRDGGATVIFQWTYSQCKPRDVIWNQNFGHIGTGLPYATGAMLADKAATGKQRPGMLLTSDLDGHLDLVNDPSIVGFKLVDGWLVASETPGLGGRVSLG